MTRKQLLTFILATVIFLVSTYFFMTTHAIPEETKSHESFYTFLFTIRFIIFIPLIIGYIVAVLRIFYTTNQIRQMKKSFTGLFGGLFFLIFGLIILIFAIQTSIVSIESEDWPTAEGIITSSMIDSYEERDTSTGDDDFPPTYTTYYEPKITYSYSVNGAEYSSDKISFSRTRFVIQSDAQEVIEKYSTGTNVTVYYNPDNPSEAVLEPGIQNSGGMICGTIGAVVFIILGALIVLGVIKKQITTNNNQETKIENS